jgi:twinkle protein
MADITEIKSRLNDRVESVARDLFPNGKKDGDEWRVGSLGGEPGKSLGVKLRGSKAGIWSDFASGEAGDLIDLWRLTKGVSMRVALEECAAYLGIEAPTYIAPKKSYKKPSKPKCSAPKNDVLAYLVGERHISEESINAYKVACEGNKIIFPFLKAGELVMAKWRDIKTKETMPTEAGCMPILFGWQAAKEDAREVIICEGEIDALTWFDYGFHALSVPFGGGKGAKQQWIDNDYEMLEQFETIYLSMDMDGPGQEAAHAIAERLGLHRCKLITLPFKDANDCCQNDVERSTMAGAVDGAKHIDVDEIKSFSEYKGDVHGLFHPEEGSDPGYKSQFPTLREKLLFRPYEWTIWTGASGSGKSQILSHASVDFIDQGAVVCVASLEMQPKQTLKRMVKQSGDVDVPSDQFMDRIFEWFDGKGYMFNVVGKEKLSKVLDSFEYARKRFGVDVFVIDSLMRLGIGVDDYKAQDEAIFQLTDWVVSRPVHVHLVAHARKGGIGAGVPATEDIKGASEIGSNAFNILSIWRNRQREEDLAEAHKAEDEEKIKDLSGRPGVILNVSKQRNGDHEGKTALWFDLRNYRYNDKNEPNQKRYLDLN